MKDLDFGVEQAEKRCRAAGRDRRRALLRRGGGTFADPSRVALGASGGWSAVVANHARQPGGPDHSALWSL